MPTEYSLEERVEEKLLADKRIHSLWVYEFTPTSVDVNMNCYYLPNGQQDYEQLQLDVLQTVLNEYKNNNTLNIIEIDIQPSINFLSYRHEPYDLSVRRVETREGWQRLLDARVAQQD